MRWITHISDQNAKCNNRPNLNITQADAQLLVSAYTNILWADWCWDCRERQSGFWDCVVPIFYRLFQNLERFSGAKTQAEAPCWGCRTQYERMDSTSRRRYVFSLVPRGQGGQLQPWPRGGSPVSCVPQSVGPACGWGQSQSTRAAASCKLCPLSCSWMHNPVGCTSFFLNQVTAVMTSIVKPRC